MLLPGEMTPMRAGCDNRIVIQKSHMAAIVVLELLFQIEKGVKKTRMRTILLPVTIFPEIIRRDEVEKDKIIR